jgi:4-amino-4-deoxy-L-arabinose transferase-like glycosyltransferase
MRSAALEAGLVGAVVSGLPSSVVTLARGEDLLESSRAVGAMVLPGERRPLVLLAAAAPVHLALSLGWAAVLARVLPEGRERAGGLVGGLAIAALDLGVIGRRIPAISGLPQGRQWADHAAFGLAVAEVLRRRRGPAARRRRRPRR